MKKYSVGEIPPFKCPNKNNSGNRGNGKSKKSRLKKKRRLRSLNPILKEIYFSDEPLDGVISKNEDEEVVSVIVTTSSGCSYDLLFQKVPQKSPEGKVCVYQLSNSGIPRMIEIMSGVRDEDEIDPTLEKFLKQVDELDSTSVLFNWECCGGCSDSGFDNEKSIELVDLLLRLGHVVMFSDYSLKALISKWDEDRFGLNPFVKLGVCEKSLELGFTSEKLQKCGIPQLEVVGKLCENGTCQLKCLSGTIVLGIDWQKVVSSNQKYKLEVLTVCKKVDGKKYKNSSSSESNLCELGHFHGPVGHAVLKFEDGQGELIVSSGHWIELTKLSTSIEAVEKYVRSSFGKNTEFEEEFEVIRSPTTPQFERESRMRSLSSRMVQQSPSCRSSSRSGPKRRTTTYN